MLLPPNFSAFLERNFIDSLIYDETTERLRYFILNPKMNLSLCEIGAELPCAVNEISVSIFSDKIFHLSANINIASCRAYKSGKILCLDASSIMAVFLLDLKSGDNVLDLCCAPGGKLVLSGLSLDAIDEENGGTVTGVDISKSRLLSAQSLVKKFKLSKARLFLQNSLDFHIGPLAPVKQSTSPLGCSRLVKLNKEKKSALNMKYLTFATSLLRKSPCLQYSEPKYSKILLDVECTHDGSLKHVLKALKGSDEERLKFDQYFAPANESRVIDQQKKLIRHAFSLLELNGFLLYCTCSLSPLQNENIIQEFLQEEPLASLSILPIISDTLRIPIKDQLDCVIGEAIRFHPTLSKTTGFFICRIMKLS